MVVFWSSLAFSATLSVGPSGDFESLASAVAASSPGDVIEIASGEYINDTTALPHGGLTFRGIGETRPIFRVTEDIPNRKGIIAIPTGADPVVVEGIHFEGARISDGDGANGAGIRMQGTGLTVRDCVFTDNQMGILAGGTEGFVVDVENSEFNSNGRDGSGYEHNIYIGTDQCSSFRFVGNYSHHAQTGHNLKSRCQSNLILYNRIMDENTGNGSYVIDLPEGGRSIIVGNLIQQGPMTENSSAIVSYGAESTNDEMVLFVAHNTIVNDKASDATAHVRVNRGDLVVLRNNLFVGQGTALQINEAGTVVDELGSLHMDNGDALSDRSSFDYHILEGSEPQDAGVVIEADYVALLAPTAQYLHPFQTEIRWDEGKPDVGAYGIGEPGPDDEPDGSPTAEDTASLGMEADKGCGCASSGRGLGWLGFGLAGLAIWRRRRGPSGR